MSAERDLSRLPGDADTTRRRAGGGSGRGRITWRVAQVAERDHNALSLEDLKACGLGRSGVHRRVQAGELFPVFPGVYAFGRPELDAAGRRMAAVKACGGGAALSHATAAAQRKMRKSNSALIDVVIPAGRPIIRIKGIRCHRAKLAPQDISPVDGIQCTSVSRTLLDLATRFGDETVAAAANEAVVQEVFDMREMEDLLSRSRGRRGVRRLRRVLERGDLEDEGRPISGLEARYASLCAQAVLPRPAINRWILLGDEYHQVDFLWRSQRVVIEVDSSRYHRSGWKLARDERRSELIRAAGFAHDRVHEDLIRADPAEAIAVARRLLGLL